MVGAGNSPDFLFRRQPEVTTVLKTAKRMSAYSMAMFHAMQRAGPDAATGAETVAASSEPTILRPMLAVFKAGRNISTRSSLHVQPPPFVKRLSRRCESGWVQLSRGCLIGVIRKVLGSLAHESFRLQHPPAGALCSEEVAGRAVRIFATGRRTGVGRPCGLRLMVNIS